MSRYRNYDFDEDIYQESKFEEECGDKNGYAELEFKAESSKTKKNSKQDVDFDDDFDEDEEDIEDTDEDTDDDDDIGDVDLDDDSDEDDEDKPKKKSKKKKSKSKKKDDDECDDCDDDDCDDSSKDDDDVDFEEECGDGCTGKGCRDIAPPRVRQEDGDDANLDDASAGDADMGGNEDSSEGSSFDTECGDVDREQEGFLGNMFKKKDKPDKAFNKEVEDAKNITDPAEKAKRTAELLKKHQGVVDKVGMEYALIPSIDMYSEEQLKTERQIMTALMEDLYKEYLMDEFISSEEIVTESETESNNEDEVYQERFFGGTGKQAAGVVKPIAKGAKRLNDMKHGVGRHGIIRNVVHRTQKDLKKGGVVYKLLTWPFLIIKNLVQTLYHKTKSFVMYKGLLLGVEVKINREISKIRKRARNLPKMALAGGIGYATAAAASLAKGEPLPLKPTDFIASEGAKLVEELGRDSMIRALTAKLAEAIEESPEAIRAVLAKQKEGKGRGKVTPDMGKDAPPVITMNQNKITVEGLINMRGIDEMLNDIDQWADITESVVIDVRSGDEASVRSYLDKMESMESKYMKDGKLNLEMIFNSKSGAVKIADFYEELSSKLTDKTKKLEKGLEKITGLENAIKEGNVQVASDTEKSLAEINASIQHTCNAFLEMIDSIDDLGKYVMSTMETYLDCLEGTSAALGNTKGGSSNDNVDDEVDEPKEKKHHHKLLHFGKHKKDKEDDVDA